MLPYAVLAPCYAFDNDTMTHKYFEAPSVRAIQCTSILVLDLSSQQVAINYLAAGHKAHSSGFHMHRIGCWSSWPLKVSHPGGKTYILELLSTPCHRQCRDNRKFLTVYTPHCYYNIVISTEHYRVKGPAEGIWKAGTQ